MLHFVCLLIISGYVNGLSLYYDSYTGTPVSVDEVKIHDKKNTTL